MPVKDKENKQDTKKKYFVPAILLGIVAVIYTFPVMRNISYWGQMDWDHFTFWNAVSRDTILRYHQFPLWNPYVNGGNVLLAHPHSAFLSPFYGFVLLFGSVIGLKLEIAAHLIVGLMGFFLLARSMRLGKNPSYLASFIFMLSSMYALHVTEGHTEWFAMAFLPWAFLYYLKSFQDKKQILGAVIFLGLVLFTGSVDVFNVFIMFLSVHAILKSCQLRQTVPLKMLGMIFIGTFLLCAVKLIPMVEFLTKFPRLTSENDGVSLGVLYKIFLSREQALLDIDYLSAGRLFMMGLDYRWHEYGAYIGIVPLILFFCGAIKEFKERWPLIMTGFICLIVALGAKSPINLWKVLHSFPVYNSLHVPSRFILGAIFSIALLSGLGLSFLERTASTVIKNKSMRWHKWLSFVIMIFVLCDLYQVNSPIFKNAFTIRPMEVKRNESFAQRYQDINFHPSKIVDSHAYDTSHSSVYPIFLSNSGILEGNEVINIERGEVRTISDSDYQGEVYLADSKGEVLIEQFSPNKIVVDIKVEQPGVLVMNQNYYRGWKVRKEDKVTRAGSYKGLISTPVLPGYQRVVFFYMPFSFLIGLAASALFILWTVIYSLRGYKKYCHKVS